MGNLEGRVGQRRISGVGRRDFEQQIERRKAVGS